MAQEQAKKRGPKPWVVKRTEVLHSAESEVHLESWQSFTKEQEAGAAVRRALKVLQILTNMLRTRADVRRALEETKP